MDDKILVTKSSLPQFDEYIDEIRDLWETHWLTNMGAKHHKLQEELTKYLDVENVDLLTNGHMALELSMQALNLQGEVITTPFTFASTTHAIVRNGLKPVFCDINAEDYTIDVTKIEELITPRTSAIVPVHVYGNVCNIEEIERIATKYGLKVIYDAAHAFGVRYKGRGIGFYGDVSCFSFHATKLFHSIEGGAVCYKDNEFGRILYGLKNFGIRDQEVVDSIGANAKMNEFCAAMGLCNLRHMDEELAKRKRVVQTYANYLGDVEGIQINAVQPDVIPNYAYFPIVIDEQKYGASRDKIYEKLCQNNIFARKYFYPLTSIFDCYKGKYDVQLTPTALRISQNVLTLPLYADLEIDTVKTICDIILGCRVGD
ncbi:MAG: DegT/DnrJ/EryC1/StrS family aminotransferase [Eubacterium sp.]|nr:DegT/DnrJ/EryC1/StrS family aminotransferase [Eubacterium sp.]